MAGSNGLLIQPDQSRMFDPEEVYRQIMQIVGRDLGLSDWGSLVNHTSYSSNTEYAHTLQNQGSGGHLNIPGVFSVSSTTVTAAALAVTGNATVGGNTTLGNANSDTTTIQGILSQSGNTWALSSPTTGTLTTTGNRTDTTGGTYGLAVTGAATLSAASWSLSGALVSSGDITARDLAATRNLLLTGVGARITSDLTNATIASRTAFQTSTVNAGTIVTALPNGTGTASGFYGYNNSTPASASAAAVFQAVAAAVEIRADSPSASYQPLNFYTSATLRASISAAGDVTISTGGLSLTAGTLTLAANNQGVKFTETSGSGGAVRDELIMDASNIFNVGNGSNVGTTVSGTYVQLKSGSTVRLNADATGIGVFAVTPVARASAYTQSYSTATKTHAALTSNTITDSFGTADSTIADVGIVFSQTTLNDNFQDLSTEINALRVDLVNLKGVVNSIIDDQQAYGWFQ